MGAKRAFREFDAESVTSSGTSNEVKQRSPSKRPRIEKKQAVGKKDGDAPRMRTRATASRVPPVSHPVRATATRGKETVLRSSVSARRSTRQVKLAPKSKSKDSDESSDLTSVSDVDYDSEPKPAKEVKKKPVRRFKAASNSKNSERKQSSIPSTPMATAADNAAPRLLAVDDTPMNIPTRTFPAGVPKHAAFALLYRQFPLCGYMDPDPASASSSGVGSVPPPGALPGGHFNAPRSAEDLYTPRFVRGIGRDKAGLCPICYESRERGGAGRADWLSMKFSAFK